MALNEATQALLAELLDKDSLTEAQKKTILQQLESDEGNKNEGIEKTEDVKTTNKRNIIDGIVKKLGMKAKVVDEDTIELDESDLNSFSLTDGLKQQLKLALDELDAVKSQIKNVKAEAQSDKILTSAYKELEKLGYNARAIDKELRLKDRLTYKEGEDGGEGTIEGMSKIIESLDNLGIAPLNKVSSASRDYLSDYKQPEVKSNADKIFESVFK